MAHGEAQIPQEIEDRFNHLFAPGSGLCRGEEGDVDIRMRRHFAAPVTAHRHQREPFAAAAVGDRIKVAGDVVVHQPDDLIDQKGMAMRDLVPGGGLCQQALRQFGAPGIERVAQQGGDRFARRSCSLGLDSLGNGGNKRAAIDDGALAGQIVERHRPCP